MVQRLALVAVTAAIAWIAGAASAQTCPTPGPVAAACAGNACAKLTVGSASGSASTAGAVPISFTQGTNDNQSQRGSDDVAAIAFTVGLPGTGTDAPLLFSCTSGNLSAGAVAPSAAIANDFAVVVENAQCNNRNRCLCPDEGAGQQRDNFVNIAVYGPKTLPEQGPVNIPKLPADGVIMTLNLKAASGVAKDTVIPLHAFSALDASKPQFSANLSIGDQSACDVSASGTTSTVAFTDGTFTVSGVVPPVCVGDCNNDHTVAINELIIGVNIALGQPASACPAFQNNSGVVDIAQLIKGVNNALGGCPA